MDGIAVEGWGGGGLGRGLEANGDNGRGLHLFGDREGTSMAACFHKIREVHLIFVPTTLHPVFYLFLQKFQGPTFVLLFVKFFQQYGEFS